MRSQANMNSSDEKFMLEALFLAEKGLGYVEPNPPVGAIIVRDGRIISRGFHRVFGGPHAEVEAISAARDAGADIRGATMYVTLEPCCHTGKTPPCTEKIISADISRVVAAIEDPDEKVAGKGFHALRLAKIDVTVGTCTEEARDLLAAYINLRRRRRPWIICKWAQTRDGFLAIPPDDGRWISGADSREYVHYLRSICDGVIVGVNTVIADDPLLTNRSGRGRKSAVVVLDPNMRIPRNAKIITAPDAGKCIIVTTSPDDTPAPRGGTKAKPHDYNAEIIEIGIDEQLGLDLPSLLDELGCRAWTRLLVEGGPKTLARFIEGNLADELIVFTSSQTIEIGNENLPKFPIKKVLASGEWTIKQTKQFKNDLMTKYVRSTK